jgi:hypothetical protein
MRRQYNTLLYNNFSVQSLNSGHLSPENRLQCLTTGFGSLVALGIGAGDVATLITTGRKVGNWWTAAAGDHDLLKALDEDEANILKRRGVLDEIRLIRSGENA